MLYSVQGIANYSKNYIRTYQWCRCRLWFENLLRKYSWFVILGERQYFRLIFLIELKSFYEHFEKIVEDLRFWVKYQYSSVSYYMNNFNQADFFVLYWVSKCQIDKLTLVNWRIGFMFQIFVLAGGYIHICMATFICVMQLHL